MTGNAHNLCFLSIKTSLIFPALLDGILRNSHQPIQDEHKEPASLWIFCQSIDKLDGFRAKQKTKPLSSPHSHKFNPNINCTVYSAYHQQHQQKKKFNIKMLYKKKACRNMLSSRCSTIRNYGWVYRFLISSSSFFVCSYIREQSGGFEDLMIWPNTQKKKRQPRILCLWYKLKFLLL